MPLIQTLKRIRIYYPADTQMPQQVTRQTEYHQPHKPHSIRYLPEDQFVLAALSQIDVFDLDGWGQGAYARRHARCGPAGRWL